MAASRAHGDRGSVLILVLVLVVVAGLIVIPLMNYTMSVLRLNTAVSERTKDVEAAKGGLRVALSDPKNVFNECDNGGNLTNPGPVNGHVVSVSCTELQEIGPLEALGYEVPVGAVIVHGNRVIAPAHNQREQLKDPTAHAEMIAITQAAESLQNWRLSDCILYVTLEPCPMCAGAILQARIPWLVFGASDPKAGAVRSLFQMLDDQRLNHQTQVVADIMADACGSILSEFFQEQRRQGKK